MNLIQLQRRMSTDVRRPLTASFGMQEQDESGASVAKLASSYIKPNDRLTSFERLEIYNRQYWFRVVAAVSEDYPALAAMLGPSRFDALVLAYLKENTSTSFTLRNLGAHLPAWLKDHREFTSHRHALMVDVARLEWAYIESYDRASLAPLMPEDFTDLDEDSRLSLQPHLHLLDLQYPVDELVLAVHRETPESDIMSNAVSERQQNARIKLPEMRRGAVYLAVHRFDHSVYYRRIDREAWLLLSAMRQRQTLGEAIEAAFANSKFSPDEQAQKIREYFAHAGELGWFCRKYTDFVDVQ